MSRLVCHETSLAKLARALACKHNLRVVFKGSRASTDGKTITLPAVGEFLDDKHGVTSILHGLLDHEVAENIEGDIERMGELIKNGREKVFTGIVNDCWIEKQYIKRYPGAESNILNMNEYCMEGVEKAWKELDPIGRICSAINIKLINFEVDFIDPMTETVLAHLEPILADYPKCQSSEDCYNLACRIIEKLEELSDNEGGNGQDDGDESNQKEEDGSSGNGGQQPQSNDDEDSSGDEESNSNNGGEGDTKSGEGEDDNSDGNGQDQQNKPEITQEMAESLKDSLEDVSYDDTQSLVDFALDRFNNDVTDLLPTLGDASRYLPYTTSGDRWEKPPEVPHGILMELRSEVDNIILPLKRKVNNILMALKAGGWLPAQEEGRLDSARLHRIFTSPNAKDFRKKRMMRQDYNTAVGIWIDHSRSMHGNKIRLATLSCLALAEALQGTPISLQIVGWTTDYDSATDRWGKASDEEKKLYTRWGKHVFIVYKDFDQEYHYCRSRLASMTDIDGFSNDVIEMENTHDGESVRIAAEMLMARPEKRKILVVIGDGEPWPAGGSQMCDVALHESYLKAVCDEIHRKTPVELIALNMGGSRMKHFYPEFIEVKGAEDIPEALLNRFCRLIREGRYKRPR